MEVQPKGATITSATITAVLLRMANIWTSASPRVSVGRLVIDI